MTTEWRLLNEAPRPAAAQMARDAQVAADGVPTVRFFRWDPPALSLGFKQPRPEWLKRPAWRAAGLELVERPTGGGIAFHGSDLSVAVIVPRALTLPLATLLRIICQSTTSLCSLYAGEARGVLDAEGSRRITYCLTETSQYAVFIGERKVAGFGVRRYPRSWLVEGSLLVRPLPAALAQALPSTLRSQLQRHAVSLAEAAGEALDESEVAERWVERWPSVWEELLIQELAVIG